MGSSPKVQITLFSKFYDSLVFHVFVSKNQWHPQEIATCRSKHDRSSLVAMTSIAWPLPGKHLAFAPQKSTKNNGVKRSGRIQHQEMPLCNWVTFSFTAWLRLCATTPISLVLKQNAEKVANTVTSDFKTGVTTESHSGTHDTWLLLVIALICWTHNNPIF